METLFSDNSKANTITRIANIKLLKDAGFNDSGLYSTSGNLYLIEHANKVNLVFGKACNVSGRARTKYFSLCKSFTSKGDAITFFNKKLKNKLQRK